MGTGWGGLADGGELAVGVVEVAEVLAAEGGGTAAVAVGEEVGAGGGNHLEWGLVPGVRSGVRG